MIKKPFIIKCNAHKTIFITGCVSVMQIIANEIYYFFGLYAIRARIEDRIQTSCLHLLVLKTYNTYVILDLLHPFQSLKLVLNGLMVSLATINDE